VSNPVSAFQARLSEDFTDTGLTIGIIAFALVLIYLAVTVHNKWVKTGIFLWEVLP
jgi:DMSO/TMAO reductase YedYZ heme-binding membrane subunit